MWSWVNVLYIIQLKLHLTELGFSVNWVKSSLLTASRDCSRLELGPATLSTWLSQSRSIMIIQLLHKVQHTPVRHGGSSHWFHCCSCSQGGFRTFKARACNFPNVSYCKEEPSTPPVKSSSQNSTVSGAESHYQCDNFNNFCLINTFCSFLFIVTWQWLIREVLNWMEDGSQKSTRIYIKLKNLVVGMFAVNILHCN